jgi:hypothetical protein
MTFGRHCQCCSRTLYMQDGIDIIVNVRCLYIDICLCSDNKPLIVVVCLCCVSSRLSLSLSLYTLICDYQLPAIHINICIGISCRCKHLLDVRMRHAVCHAVYMRASRLTPAMRSLRTHCGVVEIRCLNAISNTIEISHAIIRSICATMQRATLMLWRFAPINSRRVLYAVE